MNVLKAVASAAPRAERAIERTARPDTGRSETDAVEPKDKRTVSRAEFSALLALISGAGPRVRADLIQQLPAEGVSLVDKLLGDAAGELTDAAPGESTTGAPSGALSGDAHGRQQSMRAQEASEALRYGVLNATIDDAAAVVPPSENAADNSIVDLPSYARNRGTNGLPGVSRAAQRISAQREGEAGETSEIDRNALAVLTRIASKRGASLEQLLALGDVRGADARAALDALLAKAGTPAGSEIANNAATASAEASVLAAANALLAAAPATPVKDLDAVAPELRSRVQRVIDRMKNEYGHDVSIVESARSQERQDFLYEQGRTRPGQVVTWTRDSAHTRGEAVDVVVDGSWENAQGFARLQRIAKEEGLRTLGMKDPGHLELANRGTRALENVAPQAFDKLSAAFQRQSGTGAQATPAATAGVAQVAGVAGVAQVARIADAGRVAPPALGDGAAAYVAQANAKSANGDQHGNAFGRGERDESGKPMNEGRKLGLGKQDRRDETHMNDSAFGAMHGGTRSNSGAELTGSERAATVARPVGSEQAQRVSDIQAMRAEVPAGPLSRMTMSVENANGTQDRITVDLRGNIVDTFISTDAASAERLKMHTGDLQESLGRHGLEAETVRISGTTKVESSDARGLGADRDALRMGGTTPTMPGEQGQGQTMRERATGREWDRQQDARREQKEQTDREQQRQQASQRDWQNLFNGNK